MREIGVKHGNRPSGGKRNLESQRASARRFGKLEYESGENLRLPRPRRFLHYHFLVPLGE